MHTFHENPDRIYTEQTLKRCMLLSPAEIFEAISTNSVDPDQTTHVGAV